MYDSNRRLILVYCDQVPSTLNRQILYHILDTLNRTDPEDNPTFHHGSFSDSLANRF